MTTAINRLRDALAIIEVLEPGTLTLDLSTGIIVKRKAFLDTPIADINTALAALELYVQSLQKMREIPIVPILWVIHPEDPYSITDTLITKIEADGWSATLKSSEPITGDGYISFNMASTTDDWKVSLGDDYEFICSKGDLDIYEIDSIVATITTANMGDLIEIERVGTVIKYYIADTEVYTSTIPSTGDIYLIANIFDYEASLANMTISNVPKVRS